MTALMSVVLCILTYETGVLLHRKFPYPIVNPLLISTFLCIIVLKLLNVTYTDFMQGGNLIGMWLGPITELLAVNIYNKRAILRKNILPVIAACLAGAVTSVAVVYGLCKAFKLDDILLRSLLPKSVTTPIAVSLSNSVNGIQAITMCGLLITGIFGGMFAPQLVKLFRIKDPVAAGVAIGCCSHAVGTSTAIQMGETEGAMSSIAIGCMGLATTFVFIFL